MQFRSTTPHRFQFMRPLVAAAVLALALIAMPLGPTARAEFFQYATTTTILNGFVPPTSTVGGQNTALVTLTTPAPNSVVISLAGVTYNPPGDNIDGTGPGSDIVFATITVANLTNNTQLESIVIPYVFHIVVTDYPTFNAPGAVGSATFDIQGTLSGTVGKLGGGKQVNLTTNVLDPNNVYTKQIGNEYYTLSLFSYVPPGFFPGAFGAHVTAVAVPEPSTVALLSMGLLALATPAYRRLRRKS